MKVYIIGIGPGTKDYLIPIAKEKIAGADCLIGARRSLDLFSNLGKEEIVMDGHMTEVVPYIRRHKDKKRIAVLVSGDPGMYSLQDRLSKILKPEEYTVVPGISTLQLAFARIGQTWRDAKVVSLHGRRATDLASDIRTSEKVFLFTDTAFPPNKIARTLLDGGLDDRRAVVLERLSYPEERIIDTSLKRLSRVNGFGLCAMIIEPKNIKRAKGSLYGIGIGPGDPRLITLRAKEALDKADIIFVPKSGEADRSHARGIVEAVTTDEKVFKELVFPMTKDKAVLNKYWKKAARLIAKEVQAGKTAAFVTIGDPFIYSTYIYLLKMIRRDFPDVEIENVPGISSFSAAASAANLPLVEGGERMAIVPVTGDLELLRPVLNEFDTTILMKVGSKLRSVISLLKEMDLIKRAILISRVGHKDEKICFDLAGVRNRSIGYLSVIIVRKNHI